MKTTRLSKNFAALCLAMAGFWAAQGALAEVVVPEWKNSYTTAPAEEFYLYNTAQSKFATNSFTLCASESSATLWKYSGNNFSTNGQYLTRSILGALQFGNSGTKYPLEYNDGRWGMYYSSWGSKYYIYADPEMKFDDTKAPHHEWYFISNTQFTNHAAIVAAKDGEVFAEANQLLETAEEGDAKTALVNAINTAETAINGVNIEDASALTTINTAVAGLSDAIKVYKQSDLGQYVEALQATLNDAEGYEGPKFGFIEDALSAANAALNANPKVADDLDDANTQLVAAFELATTILADEAYTIYLAKIAQIEANIANTGEYTGYANELTGIKNEAEKAFLALESADGISGINNTLTDANSKFESNLHLYGVAIEIVHQAAAVGYDEEAGLAAVKAAASTGLTGDTGLIKTIRTAATNGAQAFVKNYEGEDPIDMTIFIENNSFELGDTTGWEKGELSTVGGKDDNCGVTSNIEQQYKTDNVDGGYFYNAWGKTSLGNNVSGRSIYQSINVPNGLYRLEALLTSDPENTTYLVAGPNASDPVESSGVKSTAGQTEFVNATCEFYVEDNTVIIGAIGKLVGVNIFGTNLGYNTWFRADNFRLTLLEKVTALDEKDATYAYKPGNRALVHVNRDLPSNQWTTLCLPMECDKPAGMMFYEVTGESEEDGNVSITVAESTDSKIVAGKPYIVKNPENVGSGQRKQEFDITVFSATNVTLVDAPTHSGEYIPFTGIFSATELNAGDIYVSTSTDASAEAPVYKELSETASNKTMKGFRAYFKVPAGANSNVRFITDDVITSIMQAIEEQQKANGTYDLSGRKANTLQKGTYIIDGKKVIIK